MSDTAGCDGQADDGGLFDLPDNYEPPPVPAELSHGERRKRLVERRIADGIHPLGNLSLHRDAATGRDGAGLRCGTCRFREVTRHHDRAYPKCMHGNGRRATHGESSDIRAWWPACRDYQPTEEANQ